MEYHDAEFIGDCTVPEPRKPANPVRLIDLEAAVAGAGVGGQAAIFITDVTAIGGNVGNVDYVAGTIPANRVVASAVSDTATIRVHFLAEAVAAFYSPTVLLGETVPTHIEEVPGDYRRFQGYFDVVLDNSDEPQAISLINDATKTTATVLVTLATEGPELQSVVLGTYPGQQTELKAGDTISISGVVDGAATSVIVLAQGLVQTSEIVLGALVNGTRSFTGTLTVANRSGQQPVTLYAVNGLGTAGAQYVTETRLLNQTVPAIGNISIAYPVNQNAVKSDDVFEVNNAVTNADTVLYSFAHGTVSDPNAYTARKNLTCTTNVYSTANNYTIEAFRAANNSRTVRSFPIVCAGVPAQFTLTIVGGTTLRTSAGGTQYNVTLASNQVVNTALAPVVSVSSGTLSAWTRSGNQYSATLTVRDEDERGAQSFDVQAQNAAGQQSTVTGLAFQIRGFTERVLTLAAFSQVADIGVPVANNSLVRVRYAGSTGLLSYRTDKSNVVDAFTIVDQDNEFAAANGTRLFLNDVAFTGSNTSGTLRVTIEEVV